MSEEYITNLQRSLVDTLKKSGALTSARVAQAFLAVPRHLFLPDEPLERAYSDIAIGTARLFGFSLMLMMRCGLVRRPREKFSDALVAGAVDTYSPLAKL